MSLYYTNASIPARYRQLRERATWLPSGDQGNILWSWPFLLFTFIIIAGGIIYVVAAALWYVIVRPVVLVVSGLLGLLGDFGVALTQAPAWLWLTAGGGSVLLGLLIYSKLEQRDGRRPWKRIS